jgi:hypothetical protein
MPESLWIRGEVTGSIITLRFDPGKENPFFIVSRERVSWNAAGPSGTETVGTEKNIHRGVTL